MQLEKESSAVSQKQLGLCGQLGKIGNGRIAP